MSAISTILAKLRSAIWAIDVRDDIADAIEQCYSDVSNPTLQTEALEAAIQEKIDEGEMAALTIGDGTITAAKLAANAVTTPKIADGSITQAKLDPNIDFVQVDDTLSQTGEAADAAAVGAAIDELNGSLASIDGKIEGFEEDVKLPILYLYGDESEIETNWQNRSKDKMNFRYTFYNPNKKKQKCGYCKLSLQGNSTLNFVKHNYNIQFYKDAGYKTKDKVDYMDLTDDKHPKWTLKSNQNDYSQARNVVSARLWGDIVHCRKGMSDALSDAPNHGAINGHPVLIYLNDKYYGLYMFNMSKSDWMVGIDEDNPLHYAVSSNSATQGTRWNQRSFSGWELEIPDEWQIVPAEEGEAENVTAQTRFMDLVGFVANSTDEEFYAHLEDRLDVTSAIDFLLYSFCICNVDSFQKNQFLVTWDGGKKWVFTAYDMDQTFGAVFQQTANPVSYDKDLFENQTNRLFSRLIEVFGAEITARYAVLRNGALSYDYMARELEICFSEFPKESKERDLAKWKVNAFVSASDLETMKTFTRKRLLWCDKYFAEVNPDRVACSAITLGTHSITYEYKNEETISVTLNPVDTTDPIIWSSSDESVAFVKQDGTVIPVSNGTATITATCGEYSDTCTVTVDLISRGAVSYNTSFPLNTVNLYSNKTYDATGEMVDLRNNYCTEKFSLQNCVYTVNLDSRLIDLCVWNENDDYIGTARFGKNTAIVCRSDYRYAISTSSSTIGECTFKPVNNSIYAKPFKCVPISRITGKAATRYQISDVGIRYDLLNYIYMNGGNVEYKGTDYIVTDRKAFISVGEQSYARSVTSGFYIEIKPVSGNIEIWIYADSAFMSQYDTIAKMNEYLEEHPINLYLNID